MGLRIGGEEIGNKETIHIHTNVNLIISEAHRNYDLQTVTCFNSLTNRE